MDTTVEDFAKAKISQLLDYIEWRHANRPSSPTYMTMEGFEKDFLAWYARMYPGNEETDNENT